MGVVSPDLPQFGSLLHFLGARMDFNKIETWEKGLPLDTQAEYKVIKNERRAVRSRVTRAVTKLNDSLGSDNEFKIKAAAESVGRAKHDLETIDEKVWVFMADDAIIEADSRLGESWLDSATESLAKADEAVCKLLNRAPSPTPITPTATSSLAKAKLPKVDLPKFSGKSPAEYQTFWNSFKSLIDVNDGMDDVQKLIYLKSCCLDQAKEIADGYSLTSENYNNFCKALKEMYGNPRLVQQSHIDNVLNLQPFKVGTLKPFLTTLETSLRCLVEYKIDQDSLAPMVVPHIERQMPREIFQKWREHIQEDDSFSTTKLIAFLHDRVRCLTTNPNTQTSNSKDDSKKQDVRPKTTSMLSNASKEITCFCCDRPHHKISECNTFKEMNLKERGDFLYNKKLCQRCFWPNSKTHYTRICQAFVKCRICNGLHQTLMHRERSQNNQRSQKEAKPSLTKTGSQHEPRNTSSESTNSIAATHTSEHVSANALHHAPVQKERMTVLKTFEATPKGMTCRIRSAIDDGSQRTWILEKTAKALRLPVIRRSMLATATAFSDHYNAPKLYDIVKISLQTTDKNRCFEMEAVVSSSDKLTVDMDPIEFDPKQRYAQFGDIVFADKYPRNAVEIELLIGNDYADSIQTGQKRMAKSGGPVAVQTIFGWVLSGRIHQPATELVSTNLTNVMELGNMLERFWKLEEVPNPKTQIRSITDEKVLEDFHNTITYNESDQQYQVEIPYKEDVAKLGNNYVSTRALYLKQQEKLSKDPEKRNKIHKIFAEQIQGGVLELITDQDTPATGVHYLPWHVVERPGHPTTPLRIVKNASFKDRNGRSLNGEQHIGPNLLPNLDGSALRFRSNPIAFISDIKKMFWQIKIPKNQQDLHRIITPEGIARQTTVMFGESSSPFLSMATCRFHASRDDIKQKFPMACKFIMDDLYMDDIPGGTNSVEIGIEALTQLRKFFASMHMLVHKINSNSKKLLSQIDGTDDKEEATVLGLIWNTSTDTLKVPNKAWDKIPTTKREFLQGISTIWDPFGGQSPLTCKGKMIMQKIWQDGSNWDAPLSAELKNDVQQFHEALTFTFEVPRYFGTPSALHIFVDASESAYAAVAYAISETGSNFLLSKTRVKPMKVVSLPRMELLAALLGIRLLQLLKEEVFRDPIPTIVWSDSTITIGWINSLSGKFKPFVGNRIAEIQRTLIEHSAQMHWVPGDQNPADIPSRGMWPLAEDKLILWMHGPEFLISGQWPVQPTIEGPNLEVRKTNVNAIAVHSPVIDMTRFSSMERLLNTMVFVLRFGSPLGGRTSLTQAKERQRALAKLIIHDQRSHFTDEIDSLQRKTSLPKTSRLIEFDPYLDENGIMRMKGRVSHNLIILHDKSHLTQLLIRDAHFKTLHSGANQTLAYLRQKYWILKSMTAVKSITKACIKCKKLNHPLCHQKMADLPDFRKMPLAPFIHTGLDYAGPLFVKTKTAEEKRWICLFTCASTRAVHLEIVDDLSTDQFLMAYSRFTSRRGKPNHLYSDNATTFTKAAKNLPDVIWQFNPPAAPWWGGFWERLVHSIKAPLKKILGKALVSDKELSTLIIQIEEQINSRPLTTLVDDPEQIPLTPAEMLIGRSFQQPIEASLDIPPPHAAFSARQKYLKNLHQSWTKRWVQEYLPTLQPRTKWHRDSENIKPGAIVLLKKENQKRHLWPLARIIETHEGRDGYVRSVTLKDEKQKLIKRPVQNLVLLEGTNNDTSID